MTNHRKTILIDLDDTANNFCDVFWGHYNRLHNDRVSPEDVTSWDMSLFAKPEVGKQVYDLMKLPGLFRELSPHADACAVIDEFLERGWEVIFVTDAPAGTSHCDEPGLNAFSNPTDDKRKWVAEHFPQVPKENIVFTSLKWKVEGDVLIDDKPDTFLKFQELNRPCILIDKPYNRHIRTEWRAFSLTEAATMITRLLAGEESA